jgi:hypothetical protein
MNFMFPLEQILTKYKFPRRTTAPITSFEAIENKVGFALPDDYKYYLNHYTEYEEFIGPELPVIWDIDDLVDCNTRTGIFENLPFTLGIGSSPASEFIALECIDNKYRVVLSPFIDLDPACHINIGDSFTDFFVRMDSGREWFEHLRTR